MATTLAVAGAMEDYGSTHDEELPVSVPMMDPKRTCGHHPSDTGTTFPSWKTKKAFVLGVIGMTTAVVSGATLLCSVVLDSSGGHARTAEAFLLNNSGGADDDKCVAALGWPTGTVSDVGDDDYNFDHIGPEPSGPFATCFSSQGGENHCWSHSYYDSGHWRPCKQKGFGEVWAFNSHTHPETCGTACTEFLKEISSGGDY